MDPVKPVDGGREMAIAGAHIGKSVIIKGELSGSENLYVDGEVEGSIHLEGHNLTIGQNGRVRANVKARDVVVQGRVDGNVSAGDRLDLRKTAIVMGDIQGKRIAVEDGAFLKGKVETTAEPKQAGAPVTASAAVASGSAPASPVPLTESKR